jgi:PBP1b-binding outer membrane lipoprotein LpoB
VKENEVVMKKMMKSSQLLMLLVAPAVVLSACTKKLDYKTEYKDKVEDKALISSEPYLYTASQGNSSRTDSGIRPYWKGEDKVVTLQFNEKELQVLEVEKDSRFQSNKTNSKVLISIPVEHIDYRCSQDRYGQCTNKEEKKYGVNLGPTHKI